MDFENFCKIISDADLDIYQKMFLFVFATKTDFTKDIYLQYVELSGDFLSKKMSCSVNSVKRSVKKMIDNKYIIYIPGGIKTKNSPNKYCLTKKLFEENQTKIDSYNLKKEVEVKIPDWCERLAYRWAVWQRDVHKETVFIPQKYAADIARAYPHLDAPADAGEDWHELWLNHIFDYITTSKFWGLEQQACSTPICLLQTYNDKKKIQVLYTQASGEKNKDKIVLNSLKNVGEVPFE